jgi:hypothetical protein
MTNQRNTVPVFINGLPPNADVLLKNVEDETEVVLQMKDLKDGLFESTISSDWVGKTLHVVVHTLWYKHSNNAVVVEPFGLWFTPRIDFDPAFNPGSATGEVEPTWRQNFAASQRECHQRLRKFRTQEEEAVPMHKVFFSWLSWIGTETNPKKNWGVIGDAIKRAIRDANKELPTDQHYKFDDARVDSAGNPLDRKGRDNNREDNRVRE